MTTANPYSPKSGTKEDDFEVVVRPPPPMQEQDAAAMNVERQNPPSPSSTGKDPPWPSKKDKHPPSPSKNVEHSPLLPKSIEDPPLPSKTDHGPSALSSPFPSKSSPTHAASSGNGSTDEATQTLLGMQTGLLRKRKIPSSKQELEKSKKKFT